mmetsp:Transcript_56294/g.138151  ORF Transcript_56294/g.138151 Transcript_56294/m.138151 type:complete len:151 (+) Transcript_56294:198-650(+)
MGAQCFKAEEGDEAKDTPAQEGLAFREIIVGSMDRSMALAWSVDNLGTNSTGRSSRSSGRHDTPRPASRRWQSAMGDSTSRLLLCSRVAPVDVLQGVEDVQEVEPREELQVGETEHVGLGRLRTSRGGTIWRRRSLKSPLMAIPPLNTNL